MFVLPLVPIPGHAVMFMIFPVPEISDMSVRCAGDWAACICTMSATVLLMSSPASFGCSFADLRRDTLADAAELFVPVICIVATMGGGG